MIKTSTNYQLIVDAITLLDNALSNAGAERNQLTLVRWRKDWSGLGKDIDKIMKILPHLLYDETGRDRFDDFIYQCWESFTDNKTEIFIDIEKIQQGINNVASTIYSSDHIYNGRDDDNMIYEKVKEIEDELSEVIWSLIFYNYKLCKHRDIYELTENGDDEWELPEYRHVEEGTIHPPIYREIQRKNNTNILRIITAFKNLEKITMSDTQYRGSKDKKTFKRYIHYSPFSMMALLEKIKNTKIKCIKIKIKDNYSSKQSWISWLWHGSGKDLIIKYKDAGFDIQYDNVKTITITRI